MIDTSTINKPRFSIRITVVGVFILATLLTATIAIGLQYHFDRILAIQSTLNQFKLSASGTKEFLSAADTKAIQATKLLAAYPSLITDNRVSLDTYKLFSEVIKSNDMLYAVYIGFADGRFYELINLNSTGNIHEKMQATSNDRWVVIEIINEISNQGTVRKRRFEYYDADFNLRTFRDEFTEFDASKRPWFINASGGKIYKTAPYLFQQLQVPGQTYSIALPDKQAVLAVDFTLETVSAYLQNHDLEKNSEIYLYQSSGEIIASDRPVENTEPDVELPPIKLTKQQREYIDGLDVVRVSNELDWPPIDYAVAGEPQGYAVDLIRALFSMIGLEMQFVNGSSWPDLVTMFKNDDLEIIHPVLKSEAYSVAGDYTDPILTMPYAIITREDEPDITNLKQLQGKTLALPHGWSLITLFREQFPGIIILETTSNRSAIEAVQSGKAYGAIESAIILHHVVDQYYYDGIRFHEPLPMIDQVLPHSYHLLVSKRLAPLVEILDLAIKESEYTLRDELEQKWFSPSSMKNKAHYLSSVPYPELLDAANNYSGTDEIVAAEINGESRFVFVTPFSREGASNEYFAIVVPEKSILAPSMELVKSSILITAGCLLLLIPVSWLFANPIVNPIKRLALENEKIKNRQYDDVEFCSSSIIEIHELSESMLEMATAIETYEMQQKELMQSLVQLIAEAIDEKSHYTAGHCARVPELSVMIAEAAETCQTPPFKDFRFKNSDQYREFKLAAWLHDCGKITTPEHIVDKSTKLEVIYNRIHEIRTRFEVLWRDAEIDYLRNLLQHPQQAQSLREELDRRHAQLQDDFSFIASANLGAEFQSEEDIARLKMLAQIPWQRHFDDRLGLSVIELERYPDAVQELPVREQLLADKLQHLIPRLHNGIHEARFGIKMEIPEYLYNQGELYNLLVARGTLTNEDRFKISEHMIGTIKLLDNVPFPPELKNVPRFASTHHETLKGTGYPRRLTAEELSIPERIIAVADIFEALTAADRPYKTPKPVSEAIEILHRMVLEGNIDRDVFILFLSSGVYKDYARFYLRPEQLDYVDIEHYVQA